MPFLSLGLLKDEREEADRAGAASAGASDEKLVEEGITGSSTRAIVVNSTVTQASSSNGTSEKRALQGGILGLADPVPSNGRQGTRSYVSFDSGDPSEKNFAPTQDEPTS